MTEILIKENIISDDKVIHFYDNNILLVLSKYNDNLEFYSSSFDENVKFEIESLNECALFYETIGNSIENDFLINVHTDNGLEQRINKINIYKNNGKYILNYINNSNSNFYHCIKKDEPEYKTFLNLYNGLGNLHEIPKQKKIERK